MKKNEQQQYEEFKTKWLTDNGYTVDDIIKDKIYPEFKEWYEKTQQKKESETQQKEKRISLSLIENLDFRIIEVMTNCEVIAPINLDSVKGGLLSDLTRNNYIVNMNTKHFNSFNSEIKFNITKDNKTVKSHITLDEVKEYFNDYFEKHPEQLQQLTIADVLQLEHIEIEENTHNVLEYGEIDIDDLADKIDDESFEFSVDCGYDVPTHNLNYAYTTVDFTVYKDGQKILDCASELEVDEFVRDLIKKYK